MTSKAPENKKRKNPEATSAEEKAPAKKFSNHNKVAQDTKKKHSSHDTKKPFKKDFKSKSEPREAADGTTSSAKKEPEFKPYIKKSQLNADGTKKEFKSKQKFDKKTRVFGASNSKSADADSAAEGGILFTEINSKVNKIQSESTS